MTKPTKQHKGKEKMKKITRISFEVNIIAEIYDYGQGISMMKVFEMLNKGELMTKTPDINLNKPVIILTDKFL